ncbi:ORF1p [Allium cepa amalgavirus 1]|uniref:ORF1p n=1 Tax=Allium cepa amalgavirus 1 TaxID=2058778 RepID=A0A2H5MHD4_9VIRU|nr:ORF1p [Allium cepa amalgavirus 1]DAB41438.1 TPA_inf: ORF1p [Allium cepa amalgavirus 1]DBA06994.1 TPA_asm: putative nucleoprotein [Allium cepa amalgavirus 1]DBA06996.1 TPA_asm: ORF1p [Allium cepa amalgavirus 1]DBA06998.1 TPA_asm: ORF1p [Allium cepa amalgavirus 1]DBA07000.1 TPA_asm: putative nucleoprotein [Allium cepa amalgavirus 1]
MSAEDFTPRTGLVDTELLVDPAAELEELHDALMPLEVLNINVKAFTRANIFALRMTVPQYIKEVRVLQNLQDVQLIRKVWTEAISHKCATLPDEADAGVCLSFARWLKRGVGAKVLSDAQHLIKLQKRAVGSVEPKVLAFVQLLDQQIADMHAERKKIQAEGQAKIDELRREIQRVEREYDEKAKASSKRFKPARKYVPPTKAKIDEECWNAYLNKVQKSGKTAPEWNAVLQEQANTMYQQLYLTQHKQDFCGLESNQIPLKVWADSKLKELADNHEFRRVRETQRILGLASGVPSSPSASASKSLSGKQRSGGPSQSAGDEPVEEHGSSNSAKPAAPDMEITDRDEEKTSSSKGKRKQKLKDRLAAKKSKDLSAKKTRKGTIRRDPHRKK